MRKGQPRPWVVSDDLWARVEPLLSQVERRFGIPAGGDCQTGTSCAGILFVLYTAIPWQFLPRTGLGFGSGDDLLAPVGRMANRSGCGSGYTSYC